jgi:A/G-specific adenine glycosylase
MEPPPGQAYAWNQALFDLGREICIARRPRCPVCPLATGCPSCGRVYAPLRRQSRFEGSFRQRRGALLRAVTESGALDAGAVDVEALESLRRDGLVDVADGSVRLPEPVG